MEALVASAISVMVIGMIYSIYNASNDTWDTRRSQAELQAQGRLAMDVMVKELREATRTSTLNPSPNLVIPSTPNNKQIDFYLPTYGNVTIDGQTVTVTALDANGDIAWDTGNRIQYLYIPGQRTLRRLEKGDSTTIAADVADIQFIDQGIDGSLFNNELKIILTLSKTARKQRSVNISFTGAVRLRN